MAEMETGNGLPVMNTYDAPETFGQKSSRNGPSVLEFETLYLGKHSVNRRPAQDTQDIVKLHWLLLDNPLIQDDFDWY